MAMSIANRELPHTPSTATMGRAGLMDVLYFAYGRDDPAHPQHSLYTGLAEQARSDIGKYVLEEAASRFEDDVRTVTIPIRFER